MEQNARLKPTSRHDHAYAIVRYDGNQSESTSIEIRVTVKKIVFDPEFADAEVRRLNELNHDKGCFYFSQVTRIERDIPDEIDTTEIPEAVLNPAH